MITMALIALFVKLKDLLKSYNKKMITLYAKKHIRNKKPTNIYKKNGF